ncbi:MAG: bifunctional DNA primase/polymerase [Smithella sp.]|jgi:hypothetical protein
MTVLETALKYSSIGYSVIPVKKDKTPLLPWELYQKERADEGKIRSWASKWPDMNIAIVTGSISGLTVVDCDSQEAIEAFEHMIHDTYYTPIQNTPRGGRHYLCKYTEGIRNKAAVIEHMDIRSEGGYIVAAPSVNGTGKGYQWVDGFEPWTLPPSPLPSKVVNLLTNGLSFSCLKDAGACAKSKDHAMFIEGTRDNDLFYTSACLADGRMAQDKIEQVIAILARNCIPPFPENEIESKVKSALTRVGRKDRNLAEEVREWVMSSNGVFLSSDVVKSLNLSSRDDMKNVSKVFERLRKDGMIVRAGDKNGCFRKLDQEIEAIDFINVKDEELTLHIPFDIDHFVKIMPKNIIVIAGEPNAGKTAFLLNIALDNQEIHETHYFSSEMGALETRERLSKFNFPLDAWRAKFWERSSDFADVIRPDALNIIDFMEIHNNFWEIGGLMKQIHDRLNKGIAIIALQKNPTRKAKDGTVSGEVGLGGFRGLEKPRLYITMSNHVLKIIKAKNWRTERNPNGLQIAFKIAQGCHFKPHGGWFKDDDPEQKYKGVIDDSDFIKE